MFLGSRMRHTGFLVAGLLGCGTLVPNAHKQAQAQDPALVLHYTFGEDTGEVVKDQSAFGNDMGLNIGVLYSIILIGLLIFLELIQALLKEKSIATLGRLKVRLSTVTWILFIIFMGIVYTRVIMILAT